MLFEVPDELEMLTKFHIEPSDSNPKDGFWQYTFEDADGIILELRFNTHESYIGTKVFLKNRCLIDVTQEGASYLRVIEDENGYFLRGQCEFSDTVSELVVRIIPFIRLEWSTLKTI